MKSKSLRIASLLFLVLSFNITYAGETQPELTSIGCRSNDYDNYNGTNREKCDRFRSKYDAATDAEKAKLTESFDREAKTAAIKAAEAAGKTSQNPYCTSPKKGVVPPSKKAVLPFGSTAMTTCDALALGNMKMIYKGGGRKSIPWKEYIEYSCSGKCTTETTGGQDPFVTCVAEGYTEAKRCESIAYIINSYGRSWENEEHMEAVSATSSSGAIGAKTTQNANGSAASVAIGGGSPIKCQSKGIETVDYDACKKFQTQLELMDGIQQVGYGAQELVYKDKLMDSQLKYANEKNTASGALKAQSESLKDQESMYQQRTAVDSVKLGYLYTIYNDFPRSSDVVKKCENISSVVRNDENSEIQKTSKEECEAAARTGQGGFALTMNQAQIDAMRAKLVNIATSAGANLLLANLLGKRADDVNNAIAKIDEFKPVDPYVTPESEAQSTFCKMNPGAPTCLTAGLERTFDTMNDNVITFGDMATGTSYGTNTNSDGTTSTGGITDKTTRAPVGPVGSVIAAAVQDNSMEKSDAAKVTTSGTGSSGGGGSGGGGGGGLGGGGGGGAPAAGAPGQTAAITSRAPNYNGGAGSFSVMGGFGINKKKAEGKAEDNPFGKLFGKDGAKQGDLNFRDLASQKVGGKGDNLFDMISKRYESVNADKRLLEYELKK